MYNLAPQFTVSLGMKRRQVSNIYNHRMTLHIPIILEDTFTIYWIRLTRRNFYKSMFVSTLYKYSKIYF